MILCVCLSPAVDITYRVDRLVVGGTNRVAGIARLAGGKAVNVARVLHALDEPVCVLAPVGGAVGDEFGAGLAELGVPADFVDSGFPTRHTLTVIDAEGTATLLSEPAQIDCWADLAEHAAARVLEADAVVISGTVPTGAPTDAMSTLVRLARDARRPVLVDTSGPALADALSARPSLVKPNRDELADLVGDTDPSIAVRELARASGAIVVASLGADGVAAAADEQFWQLRPARVVSGNPTGAGDALVAALARGLRAGTPLIDVLRDSVALSAAAVAAPHAGEVDRREYDRQRAGVLIEISEARR